MLAALGVGKSADTGVATKTSTVNPQGKGLSHSLEENALELLGQGIDPTVVANALGVAAGRISQLLANKEFAKQVVERRFVALASHTKRDNRYDSLEDDLINKLESHIPFMSKTSDILNALRTVNSAKRRGQQVPDSLTQADTIVPLVMPTVVIEKFSAVTNNINQVVHAGGQDLVTIQSGSLMDKWKQKQDQKQLPNKED